MAGPKSRIIFCGFVKSVIADFPYTVGEYFNENFPHEPLTSSQREVFSIYESVFHSIIDQHSKIDNNFYAHNGSGFLDIKFLDHYLILCLRFASELSKSAALIPAAEAIYYSSRVRCSADVFYRSAIGECFMPTHPLGTCLDSHSSYGVGLRVFNGVHIGPNKFLGVDAKEMQHPTFGDGVILLAKCSIYGSTKIGNNVIVSQGAVVIDETIPDNCIVMGQSPNLKALKNKNNNLSIFNLN